MKAIVFGATGATGQSLIAQAHAAGHAITAFSRRAVPDTPAAVITGDVLDAAAVTEAVRGHDVVFSCLGTRPWKHQDICSGGIASIIAAMQSTGVRRVVAMSSQGVGDSKMSLAGKVGASLFLRRAFADKQKMEEMLAATDLDWTAVRPGFLTNGKARGTWRAADDGSIVGGMIGRADTAAFMLQQAGSTEWIRRRPVLVW